MSLGISEFPEVVLFAVDPLFGAAMGAAAAGAALTAATVGVGTGTDLGVVCVAAATLTSKNRFKI